MVSTMKPPSASRYAPQTLDWTTSHHIKTAQTLESFKHWLNTECVLQTYLGLAKRLQVAHRSLIPVSFCSCAASSTSSSRLRLVSARSRPSGAMSLPKHLVRQGKLTNVSCKFFKDRLCWSKVIWNQFSVEYNRTHTTVDLWIEAYLEYKTRWNNSGKDT